VSQSFGWGVLFIQIPLCQVYAGAGGQSVIVLSLRCPGATLGKKSGREECKSAVARDVIKKDMSGWSAYLEGS
jgi:hypothetical protein